jgi:hypothetical protein
MQDKQLTLARSLRRGHVPESNDRECKMSSYQFGGVI